MTISRPIGALLGALAAACALTGQAGAAAKSCASSYSYAGLAAHGSAHGVAAVIAPLAQPNVVRGHVAAWVGVGGAGYGPHGTDEWLQVGLSAFEGSDSGLYFEIKQPSYPAKYFPIREHVAAGERHRLAVLEVHGRPSVWRVWVDGSPASPAFYLPGSKMGWEPEATAESWNDGAGVCNGYSYAFSRVALARARGGSWQRLSRGYSFVDPGYRMLRRSTASFVATGNA